MNTNDLMEGLARGLTPVAPLWSPARRAVAWSVCALFYVGILVAMMSAVGPDADRAGAGFWASQLAAVVLGLAASWAALGSVVPGLPKHSRVWAALAAFVWLATLVVSSPWNFDWATVVGAGHEWACVGFIAIGGAPLMLVLTVMLRRGAPLSPGATAAFAALAVGGLANVGACLSLPHANSAITFAWHGGVVVALVALAGLTGHLVFRWRLRRSPALFDGAPRE
jgi:hypothetical protein